MDMGRLMSFYKGLATVLGVLVMIIMLLIVIDVGGRYLFDSPLLGGVEVSRVVLAWILFLALVYGLVQGAHVRVSLVTNRFPPRLRLMSEVFTAVLSLGFFALAAYSGWEQFKLSYEVSEEMPSPIWIPFWLPKLAVPVGCFLMAAQLGIDLVFKHFKLDRSGKQ
jgi:TRAP-type C4-dicarboxylate transport system permease small subunit